MNSFFPDQLWTSEAEPELGAGIVVETSKGRVRIEFPAAEETRLYASESAPLRRVQFKPGDTVVDKNGQSMEVERVLENGDFFIYFGKEGILSEAELGNVEVKHGADERLLRGDVEFPATFSLRRKTLEYDHRRRTSTTHGFMGGRIDLIPHQLYIAAEVSGRYAPRVLLSDEVGLGKTIEACLILHRLLLKGRISRALILVPDSLLHQWFIELLRRFNMWFHIFDEERCEALEEGAPDGNPFLDDQLVLCSTSFLANSQKRSMQAWRAGWDMLVVDEAHHLEWSVGQPSPQYLVVEALSKSAEGLLLLTATPEQLGLESHFARLRLLDPDRYSDFETFENESNTQQTTADVVEKLKKGEVFDVAELEFLEANFSKSRIEQVKKGNEFAQRHLIQDLLDQHGPGRVIFRNTRSALSGFPKRKAQLVELEGGADPVAVLEKMGKELAEDIEQGKGSEKQRQFHFKEDLRLQWLLGLVQKLTSEKVLLICNSKAKVLALEKAIKEQLNLKIGVFHEDLTLVQRDRNAAWFAEAEGARLLLCSEIGSEGRNFQFTHHLVLFDLPLQPELLEQRIGRLDRIGQTADINIYIPYLKGSGQEALVRWYHDGLNAFEENLKSGNKIAGEFGERLVETARSFPSEKARGELEKLISDTRAFHLKLQKALAEGRDRLLEMNSFRPEIAAELVEQIWNEDQAPELERYMLAIFEHFSVEVEDIAGHTYLLKVRESNAAAFPLIPEEGTTVTFDRSLALGREEITFLSWDHPMVTGVIDLVLSGPMGSASYGKLYGSSMQGMLLELVFVLESVGQQRTRADRFLPVTPIRVVVDYRGRDVTEDFPVDELDRKLRVDSMEELLENETLVETIVPNMLASGTGIAEALAREKISDGQESMNRTMDREISRLELLQQKNNHVRQGEIDVATREQNLLEELIEGAKLRLDAIQLIERV